MNSLSRLKLPPEDEAFVTDKIESGEYSSAVEVVSAGLRALREQDGIVTDEQLDQALKALDHLTAHPETARPIDDVFRRLRERHEARMRSA